MGKSNIVIHKFVDTLERSNRLLPTVITMLRTIEDVIDVRPSPKEEQHYGDEKLTFRTFHVDNKFRDGRYYNRDILVETVQNEEYQTQGWIDASKTDFIFYGWENNNWTELKPIAYLIPLKRFRTWFNPRKNEFPQIPAYNELGKTLNRCVPISQIPEDCIIKIEKDRFQKLPINLTHFLKNFSGTNGDHGRG